MADTQKSPSLFSAPATSDPTAQLSQVSGFNMAGMTPMLGPSAGGVGPIGGAQPRFGSPSQFSGSGTTIQGQGFNGQQIASGSQIPNVSLPTINFPNMSNVLAGMNPAAATNTAGLPKPMDMNAVNAALAQMKVPNANLPAPLDPRKIFAEGNMIGPQDTQNLANAIYQGGETLVAPQREQQMIGMREQLAQAGILNSPSGLALERVLNQDQMQQDNSLAAQATQTATEVQLSREQLRTNVAAQAELGNQQQQFQSAMQTQQLQAEMAAQKAGLNIEALSTRFNQQLAVSTLAIQKFFEFGNLMLGAAGLATSGASAAANYALGGANIAQQEQAMAIPARQAMLEQQHAFFNRGTAPGGGMALPAGALPSRFSLTPASGLGLMPSELSI